MPAKAARPPDFARSTGIRSFPVLSLIPESCKRGGTSAGRVNQNSLRRCWHWHGRVLLGERSISVLIREDPVFLSFQRLAENSQRREPAMSTIALHVKKISKRPSGEYNVQVELINA